MPTLCDQVVFYNSCAGAWAAVREVCGSDEETVGDTGTPSAIALIDRLLVSVPGTPVGPGSAAALTATDRDRVLAAVHRRVYGTRIRSTLSCGGCADRFDMDFNLDDLLSGLGRRPDAAEVQALGDGVFQTDSGMQFRLPTGEEECACIGLSSGEAVGWLASRCLVRGAGADEEALQLAMEVAGPVADVELQAQCPECGGVQPVHFDLQRYVLSGLANERQGLATEVHLLARAYGWSRTEIMEMPRSQRKSSVALVTGDAPVRWDA